MPKECSVCNHPQYEEINAALLAKASVRDVSRRVGVSKSAVDRHKRGCLPQIQERGRELRSAAGLVPMLPADQSTPYIDRIERLTEKMEMIMDGAIRRADDKLAIIAGREVTRNLELFGKASGELSRDTALGNQVPMFILPEGARISVTPTYNLHLDTTQPVMRDVTPEKDQLGVPETNGSRASENAEPNGQVE